MKNSALSKIKKFIAVCNAQIKRAYGKNKAVKPPVIYHTKPVKSIVQPVMYAGNIRYKNLKELAGKNITFSVPVNELLNLVGIPIFYSCRINSKNKTALVTLKECNVDTAARYLGMNAADIIKQSNKIENNRIYHKIKTTAAKNGEKLIYRIIDSEQLTALRQTNITFAAFELGDKFSITLLPSDATSADEIIYSIRQETEFEHNRRINRELKAEAAKIGSSVRYKVIGRRELELISKSDIKFAFFEKNGKYNISFLASDEGKINNLIYGYGRKK